MTEPNASNERFNIYRRRLPHWRQGGSVYYVTYRVLEGKLSEKEIVLAAQQIKRGHKQFYALYAGVVMPDHVHIILQPIGEFTLSRIMKGIKGKTARLINTMRQSHGSIFMDENWDRIVRDDAELQEKLTYVFNNPLKEGLCDDPWKYPGWVVGD